MKIGYELKIAMLLLTLMIAGASTVGAFPAQTLACNGCHTVSTAITVTTDATSTLTVSPGQSFTVNTGWSGGSTTRETVAKWPSDFTNIGITRDNSLFSPNPVMSTAAINPSGTLTSTLTAPAIAGNYVLRVYAATAAPFITNFQDVNVVVSVPATGSIAGMKFNDLNNNGVKDTGEPGLANWQINLARQGGPTVNMTTGANGNYNFTNLAAGTYTVSETLQAGWTQTLPTAPGTYTINLAAGQNSAGNDFGNFQPVVTQPGSIAGMKFNDLNNNGTKDTGEPGLANWQINLTRQGGPTVNMMTDANGNYNFTNLAAGTYTVSETLQAGWTQTLPTAPGTYTINLAAGQNSAGNDFGNFQPVVTQPGSIAGMKFNDLNNNGTKDTGEPGLANWQINLTRQGGPTVNMMTDANGNYNFTNLAAGTYTVSETLQAGWTQTLPTAPGTYTINLAAGQNSAGNDFGNFQPVVTQPGSIAGMKFNDLNNNGAKDTGEPGLANWQINLARQGGPTVNMMTDANGNYNFTNLAAGTYTVSETLQAGWTQTLPTAPGTYTINLAAGQNSVGNDFGNFKPAVTENGSISGFKIKDMNKNGERDAGEVGLAGWKIELRGIGVETRHIKKETTTDATGAYMFDDLPAGKYLVKEKFMKGYVPTSKPVLIVTLAKGEDSSNNNFMNRFVREVTAP